MDNNLGNIITELDQYIASGKNFLENVLASLSWTVEDSLKESTCSKIIGKKQFFDRNDPLLPESFGCKNSIVIDKSHLEEILNEKNVLVPEKFSDIQINFTREKKAKFYDYVIANTAKTSEPELKVSFPNDNTDDNAMTFAEIVAKAKKKDKQLQRKYRTSKPTHIEEVRNLVQLQMVALDNYFNPDPKSQISSDKNQKGESRRSGCRYKFEIDSKKSKRRNTDENLQNKLSNSRKPTTSHHQNKTCDKGEDSMRSRSTDRSNPLLDRKSLSVERKNPSIERRSRNKDKTSVGRTKKKEKRRKRSKSSKTKKKHHKHHRKHAIAK